MEQHYNDMEIRYFDVSELKNYERNPKKHPQSQIDNLVHCRTEESDIVWSMIQNIAMSL